MGRTKERSYLLFIYGNFIDDDNVKKMITPLLPVLSRQGMKYIWGDYGVVCMFYSKTRFAELSDFVFAHIAGEANQYFLTEKTDKLSVYGPDKVMEHLLSSDDFIPSLDDQGDSHFIYDMINKDFNLDVTDLLKDFADMKDMMQEDDDENEIEKIKKQSKTKSEEPSLDDILEKIQIKGLKSLSLQEKKLLDNYSHGK